jgi:hypothetical protein
MDKTKKGLNLESKDIGVTQSSAEENKSECTDVEIDNTKSVSTCENTEVMSPPEGEVTEVVPLTLKDTLTKTVVSVPEREIIQVLKHEMNEGVESGSERKVTEAAELSLVTDSFLKCKEAEGDSTEVVRVGEAEGSTCTREKKTLGSKVEEQQELKANSECITEPLMETQMEEVECSNGSQKTECVDVKLIEPPVVFQDTSEKIPVAQIEEAVHDNSDNLKIECKDAEEADKNGSSEETYCSESR